MDNKITTNKITTMERGMQRRTELLLGKDNLEKIQSARVLVPIVSFPDYLFPGAVLCVSAFPVPLL